MKIIKLSESDSFASTILLTTSTEAVHIVPEGETHLLNIRVTNVDNVGSVELFGTMGEGTDFINHAIPLETVHELFRDVALVGPAALSLRTLTGGRLHVSGSATVV